MEPEAMEYVVALFRAYWPQHPSTEVFFGALERQVADLNRDVVIAALDVLAVESPRYAPGPGQVRERAVRLVTADPPDAALAWGEVTAAISSVGYVGEPVWSDSAIADVVAGLGGWQQICRSENQVADRAHFMKMYAEHVTRQRRELALPPSVRALPEVTRALADSKRLDRALEPGG